MYEPMYQGYSSSSSSSSSSRSSGRLPPIHAIGKAKTVDEDEPPDVPLHVYGFEVEADHSFSSMESVFDASDAEDVCKLLRKAFHMLGPGRHACKRNPDHGGSHFVHCRRAFRLGGHYSQVRRLLEERAWMELLRDCVYRVRSAQLFLEELQALLNAEYRTAYAIRHGCVLEAPVSKLYCLNALCEDLRVHAGAWNSIKQRVNTSRWLRPLLGSICRDLAAVQRTFASLCDRAIFVMNHLVHVGFEVLAHCDMGSLTSDILWNITRGLEDFNNIVSMYRTHSSVEGLHNAQRNPDCHSYPCLYLHPAAAVATPAGRLSEGIKSIPFQKVLAILANERSRYAAQLTHQFFFANDAFRSLLANLPPTPPFHWEDDTGSAVSSIHLLQSQAGGGAPSRDGSSDFHHHHHHHSSLDLRGSHASLRGALLHVGNLRVPDLSSLPSPLLEFSQKEQQFADNFLQIVCTSTSLLRKNDAGSHHRAGKSKHKTADLKAAPPMSPVVGRQPRVHGDTPVLSRSDSRRKTVSWGDNADSSIRTQVVAMYMNVLWQHFGRNLDLFLDEPAWAGKVGLLQSEVGTVFTFSDIVLAVVRHMIEVICMKDIFPSGSLSPLLGVVVRLHALSAFSAWDTQVSASTSSQISDKCYPCMVTEGQYSTRSALMLRKAYLPLLSLLQEVCRNMPHSHNDSGELMPQYDLDLSLVSGVSCRLLSACKVSHAWCSGKLHHSLASWNTKVYLFVANTDLKILKDYGQRSCQLLQMLTEAFPHTPASLLDQLSLAQVTHTAHHIGLLNTQMQNLEESSARQFSEKYTQLATSFFQEHLPPAKAWRRKVPAEFPEDASSYVQPLWDHLMCPVLEGIAKLPDTSQLEVLTAVVTGVSGAWTSLFLKDKVKFSLYGAQQLGVDFDNLRSRLLNDTSTTEVRRGLQELSVFRQLSGIVQLLKRQPFRRATSRFRDCSTEDLSCESGEVAPSRSASRSELPANMEESHDATDVCYVPNSEEWLALRVIGGTRSWRFPSCFGNETGQR